MNEPTSGEVLKLCEKMRECDDSHGMYSDHEGDESGPTWHLWQQGYEDFKLYCQRAVADHEQALFLWKQLAALNERRQKLVAEKERGKP